ncbi:outer membrane beta-barrel protein [Pseudooceanicola sp. 216_PA32_1]|uniref:Outer membrane beta-barrel protein n=1 Tax=Pseudooceanicola pacificus TaxID=2676438 RepID=A0A844W8B8_9RHOB|nr:outer membrane beta-barrel protein [Pseudooceanicola pacificus]MWB79385.1 outer membrane beta-barrel protein [Pseudooceanicola pacificus]
MLKRLKIALLALLLAPAPALAEIELNVYTGYQTAPHSRINGTYPAPVGGPFSALIGWKGKSFSPPPYYGVRATWWQTPRLGFGLEFSHNKVYADPADMAAAGFSRLEMTDGLNILTANAYRRWPGQWGNGAVSPYVGAGIGVAIPHVEVTTAAGGPATFGYQYTGPAARLTAGASYKINDRWSVFGEYQFTWTDNEADLDGGGSLSSRILNNAINLGVGFSF